MKIAIVNDITLIAEALRRAINNMPEHEVVWVAHTGEQAVHFCTENRPDLILMDLLMPDMDGVEATRRIMQQTPCAILIVTASPEDNTNMVFRALGAGALDVAATPVVKGDAADGALLLKIRTISRLIKADTPANGSRRNAAGEAASATPRHQADTLVAIGASTGGPVALARIFSQWTPPANATAVIVQHIDQAFTDSFAAWLSDQIGREVEVIEDGSALLPGRILIAKTNDHLLLDAKCRLAYSTEPADYAYRPSINVFFGCIARHWKRNAVGVLLTGMGRDGAEGLRAMRLAGKLTIAQDRDSSAVYGMPRAAAELGAADLVLPLDRVAMALHNRINGNIVPPADRV
jgi:two-component system response regulator WspF